MTGIDLSIIIIEYHGIDLIEACVASLEKHLGQIAWECLVISNSEYKADELEAMRRRLPAARVIANGRNRGYAGGVNRALPECRAPFIFVLNPDCRMIDDNLPELITFLQNNPDVAVVGPKVIDDDWGVQPSCRRFPYPWTFILVRSVLNQLPSASVERRRYLMEDFNRNTEMNVDWISGGAMMVRKSAVEIVGPMDERYFLYMEDVDWCRRFWGAGLRVVYLPVCSIVHAGRHESIQGGLRGLLSRHTRMHLVSMIKYFLKYSCVNGWSIVSRYKRANF